MELLITWELAGQIKAVGGDAQRATGAVDQGTAGHAARAVRAPPEGQAHTAPARSRSTATAPTPPRRTRRAASPPCRGPCLARSCQHADASGCHLYTVATQRAVVRPIRITGCAEVLGLRDDPAAVPSPSVDR